MLLQDILVVCVSSEHPLVVHDIEGLTTLFFLRNWRIEHTVSGSPVFVLVSHDLWLSTFK